MVPGVLKIQSPNSSTTVYDKKYIMSYMARAVSKSGRGTPRGSQARRDRKRVVGTSRHTVRYKPENAATNQNADISSHTCHSCAMIHTYNPGDQLLVCIILH